MNLLKGLKSLVAVLIICLVFSSCKDKCVTCTGCDAGSTNEGVEYCKVSTLGVSLSAQEVADLNGADIDNCTCK